MGYYFDTSALRKISNKIDRFTDKKIFTSSLSIFELISGISERDYEIRKVIISNILNSKIIIDWDSYRMKIFKAFQIPFNDLESKIIKRMAESISNSLSFKDLLSEKIYISSNYYTLENFINLDYDISSIGINESINGIKKWRQDFSKMQRKVIDKELFENNLLSSYIHLQTEIATSLLVENTIGYKRPSEEYFKALEIYDGSLDMYISCDQLKFSLSQLKGMQYGKNDTIDILHTVYLSENDIIVSDDKIFKELGKVCKDLTCLNYSEFITFEEK